IPKLLKLTETTTPNKKIAIGTKSSIGIAYPLHYMTYQKRHKTTHTHSPPTEWKSIGILPFMQLIVYGLYA
ncbi:MAG: hypothetical protein WCA63_07990, partial [Gallionella sp.]